MTDKIDPNNVQELNELAALKHADDDDVTILAIAYASELPVHGGEE